MKFLSKLLKLLLILICMSFLPYSQCLYTCICHPIFTEPWLVRKYLNIFTNILHFYTQILYPSSNIYVPWLIHQDPNIFTKIVQSYTEILYSSSNIYVPWLILQDPMILLFESYPDFSLRIQLIYCLAYWFVILPQKNYNTLSFILPN